MTLPSIRQKISLKVNGVQKFIRTVPKTPEFKIALDVLKKQLVNYRKYIGDPDLAEARNVLANAILEGVAKIKKRLA